VAVFSLWPLGRAHDIPVSALFRDLAERGPGWPRKRYLALVGGADGAFGTIAVVFAWDRRIATIYVGAAGGGLRAAAAGRLRDHGAGPAAATPAHTEPAWRWLTSTSRAR
jgi:predicted lysophospholipase L1 biosynthesis ABC-type transport system permease subunit